MPQHDPQLESAEGRQQRLTREAKLIDAARAETAAGQLVSLDAIEAWIDSWDTDHELPPPEPGQ